MKFLINNAIYIGLAVGSGLMLLWPMLRRGAKSVSPSEAVLLINRNQAIVLDVRDDAEFAAGHLQDARHIPLAKLDERLAELQKFREKPVIVHCQSGVRSSKAAATLRKHEFTQVYELDGGVNAWTQAKLPLVKG
ncbi:MULTISPECIES: rhodanese-like domain-containing protein [Methylovorus]|uniref:rhodanese-like domain-containing protein n=1 Tax=Methylovorus TaxID=81682 RepID=UPI0001EC44C7|nr:MULTISPECIES: rhodanese-like domain-containing protein [Methylovorus]ADQ83759.1 Rhodanese domain protein [Methylovorus sp. MP688]KAF0836413.1 rhodanese-related sulfurtransferase [Methylovorus glucosotrophus]